MKIIRINLKIKWRANKENSECQPLTSTCTHKHMHLHVPAHIEACTRVYITLLLVWGFWDGFSCPGCPGTHGDLPASALLSTGIRDVCATAQLTHRFLKALVHRIVFLFVCLKFSCFLFYLVLVNWSLHQDCALEGFVEVSLFVGEFLFSSLCLSSHIILGLEKTS